MSVALTLLLLGGISSCGKDHESENLTSGGSSEQAPVSEEHLLDEAEGAGDCTGSGCSDDGEFLEQPTAGDIARQQAGGSTATGTELVEVPSLIGLSPADAKLLAEEHGLRIANGSIGAYGVVSSQNPREGAHVPAGSSILVSIDYSNG
jgi:hypothetical protein